MVFIVVRRHFVDVFALYRRIGMAGSASEGLTNVGLMRRASHQTLMQNMRNGNTAMKAILIPFFLFFFRCHRCLHSLRVSQS